MNTKKINKIKLGLNTLIAVLIICATFSEKYVRRFFDDPIIEWDVENSESELFAMLLDKQNFAKDWQWDLITTFQINDPHYNKNLKEYAKRHFHGIYKTIIINLDHHIYKYKDEINLSTDYLEINDGIIPAITTLVFNQVNPPIFQDVRCFSGTDSGGKPITQCLMVVNTSNPVEKIEVKMQGNLTKAEIMEIITNIGIVLQKQNQRP